MFTLIFECHFFDESIEFSTSEKHRVPEGSRKVSRGFPEGIPEGFLEMGSVSLFTSGELPVGQLFAPVKIRKLPGSFPEASRKAKVTKMVKVEVGPIIDPNAYVTGMANTCPTQMKLQKHRVP